MGEYQVQVDTASTLTELSIKTEPLPAVSDLAALAHELESALQTAFNLRIPVTVVPQGSLPRFEMKAQRWVRA